MAVVINGTTGITSVNGSAAAPSVTGTDTDTGIVYGTNTLSFATNGATVGTFDSSGQFYIASNTTKFAVGSAPLSDRHIYFTGASNTSGANQFGVVQNPTYPNTVTSTLFNMYIGPNLTSGATLTNAHILYLEAGNYAGSTVTNKYGIYQAGSSDKNYFAGNVTVNNGITFPASQSASSDANTLDDYEEGSWTPQFSATGYTFAYTSNTGTYTKIGNQVIARGYIRLSGNPTGSGSTNMLITNLPFFVKLTNSNYTGHAIVVEASSTLFTGIPAVRVNANATNIAIFDVRAGASPTTTITPSNMNSSMEFEFFVQYMVD